jgi:hypothetical protein
VKILYKIIGGKRHQDKQKFLPITKQSHFMKDGQDSKKIRRRI